MRWGFLAAVVADAILTAVLPAMSPGFWLQPGSLGHVWPALVMLSMYGVIVGVASARHGWASGSALWFGSMVGLGLGVVEMANIAIESYSSLGGSLGVALTADPWSVRRVGMGRGANGSTDKLVVGRH